MTDSRVAELVERAFDYRGYIVLRRSDGSELVGFVYDRNATDVELFDEAATHRVRVPLAEVADITFTGEDTARKSQQMWERRKGTLEPRETSAWGEWRGGGPDLLALPPQGGGRRRGRGLRVFQRRHPGRGRGSRPPRGAPAGRGGGGGPRRGAGARAPLRGPPLGTLRPFLRGGGGGAAMGNGLESARCGTSAPREISCSSPAAPASPPLRWKWPFAGSVRCWWSRRHTREGARHRRQRLHRRRGGAGAAAPGNSRPGPAPPWHRAERSGNWRS